MGKGNITTGRMHGKIGNLQYQQWKSKTVVRTLNPKGKKNRQASQVNRYIFDNIKKSIQILPGTGVRTVVPIKSKDMGEYHTLIKANKVYFSKADSNMGGLLLPGSKLPPIYNMWYDFSDVRGQEPSTVNSIKLYIKDKVAGIWKTLTPFILEITSDGQIFNGDLGTWETSETGFDIITAQSAITDKGYDIAIAFMDMTQGEPLLYTMPVLIQFFTEPTGEIWEIPQTVASTLGQMTLSNLLYKDIQVNISLQMENIPGYVTFDSIEFPGENVAFADNPLQPRIIQMTETTFTQTVNDIYANSTGVTSCYLYDSKQGKRVSTAFTTVLNYTKYTASELQTNCYCQLTYEYMAIDDMTISYINMHPKKPTGTVSNIYGKPRVSQGYPLWYPDYVDALLYLEDPDINATGQVTGTVATCGSCVLTTKDGDVDISERFMINCINITS